MNSINKGQFYTKKLYLFSYLGLRPKKRLETPPSGWNSVNCKYFIFHIAMSIYYVLCLLNSKKISILNQIQYMIYRLQKPLLKTRLSIWLMNS